MCKSLRFVRSAGFTLLELLVVMLVLAMMAGLATFSIGRPGNQLTTEAERLYGVLNLAAEEAVLTNTQFGLRIAVTAGAQDYLYQWLTWEDLEWVLQSDKPFNEFVLTEGMEFSLKVEGMEISLPIRKPASGTILPQVHFLSSGESTEFELAIIDSESGRQRRILGSGFSEFILDEMLR